MGWRDGTPLNQPQAAPPPLQQPATAPTPTQSGWRSGQPLNQPAAASPPSPAPSSPPSSQAPAAASPQGQGGVDLGSTPLWNKPADASWGDIMLAHLSRPFEGAGQAVQDYSRVAANTFGVGDRMIAQGRAVLPMMYPGLFGPGGDPADEEKLAAANLVQERAKTAAASERLGPYGSAIANMIGYAPLGELGIAGRLGGGVLGAMGEGALAGGAGAAGHDENVVTGALGGGALGLAGGVGSKILNYGAGKLAGAPVNTAAADVTSSLKDARDAAYDKLKDVKYNPDDLLDTMDQIKAGTYANDPGGDLVANAPRSMAAFNSLYTRAASPQNYFQTAHGVLTTIDKLNDISRSAGPERDVAPLMRDGLNDFLRNANPANADLGPGDAAQMLEDAKGAHQQYANARDLQQMGESLKGFGASPSGQAQNIAETYYNDPASPQYQALSKIANAGGAPLGQNAYTITHGVVHPVVEGLALAALPPAIAPAAAAGATFLGLKPAIGAALGAGSKAATQKAISAAYPTLTGRQLPQPPGAPDLGQALRLLLFGKAASGF